MTKIPRDFTREGLAAFRALQEEMLSLSREYGEARLATWSREIQEMASGWEEFLREWQGNLEQMSGFAFGVFEGVAAQGEAASRRLSQSWQESLADMSQALGAFEEGVFEALDKIGGGWPRGGGEGSEDWLAFLGFDFSLGGLFHEGGMVEAHRGLVVNPEALLEDERLACGWGKTTLRPCARGGLRWCRRGRAPATTSPSRCRVWMRPALPTWTGTGWCGATCCQLLSGI